MEAAGLGPDADDNIIVGNVIDAQTVGETRFCKRGGCPGEACDTRGRYAGLCLPHKRQQIEEDKESGALQQKGTVSPPKAATAVLSTPDSGSAVDLVKLVKALEKPARRFQRAIKARRATKAEASDSLVEFRTALAQLRDAAQTLIEEAS